MKRKKSSPPASRGVDPRQDRIGESMCLQRGYCGPFTNQGIYDSFPDPRWHGMAECVHCHSTVKVSRHQRHSVHS